MSDSYPSWLPKRPPPPAPTSTYQSSVDHQPHRRAADIFPSPGRKPTPRSVRIVAHDPPWREPTGDSAETRVPLQPQRPISRSSLPPPPPLPRFGVPNLHLSLLRSPALSMRIRYMLHPLFIFGHLILQTYFDFNVVFMLLEVSAHPGPNNSVRNWSLATVAYILCYALQVICVFLLYEVIYSFWRRWRVKRPLVFPIYLSSPAHDLAALTSYNHFCFFAYIRCSARPPWPAPSFLRSRSPSPHPSSSPPQSSPPLSSPRPSSPRSTSPRPPQSSSPRPSHASPHSSNNSSDFAFSDYIAESCYWYSQNGPTVMLLLPRAALSLSLLLASTQPDEGRDSTYFDANGRLTGYARGLLFANAVWTAWRALVLLGGILGLWILSGTACAGLCGPRYRWEEENDHDWEKRLSGATSELAYPRASELENSHSMSDGWEWKQGTRERVREAWEFCLTSVRSKRGETTNVRGGEKPEEEFAGLEEVLAAVAPRVGLPHRTVLSSEFYTPREGREALSDIIPPADEVRDAFGSQRSRRSDPLRVLPYPLKEFQATAQSGGGTEKGKEKEAPEASLIPFPSPVPDPEEEVEADQEEGAEEDDDEEEGEELNEEDVVEGRMTSESMSSLGQPVASRYPFAFRRTARSSASASHGTPSQLSPHSATASSSPQTHSSHSTRGSRSTPSTRGSRALRSTPSNKESTDSPRSPGSGGSPEGPFIPPPRRHPSRRRRAGTAPSLRSSPNTVADPALEVEIMPRTRAISASNSSSSHSRRFDPEPEALYESVDDLENDGEGRVPSPVADGSQEEAEKEDSVGLLSTAPSPKGSLAGMRQHFSHRKGNGSRSGSSAGSPGSHGRSASASASGSPSAGSARSRAQSLIQSLGQRASLGEFGTRPRVQSRASSVVRNSDSQYSDSPRSAAGTGTGTGTGTGSGSASASASGTGSGRPSGEGAPGIEHTFGRPGELQQQRERLERMQEASSSSAAASQPSLHLTLPDGNAGVTGPESGDTTPGTNLRRAGSDVSGTAPSESTERAERECSEVDRSRTDLSTAHASFVTAPATIESTTTTTDDGDDRRVTLSTWALREHGPSGPWGHNGPA